MGALIEVNEAVVAIARQMGFRNQRYEYHIIFVSLLVGNITMGCQPSKPSKPLNQMDIGQGLGLNTTYFSQAGIGMALKHQPGPFSGEQVTP